MACGLTRSSAGEIARQVIEDDEGNPVTADMPLDLLGADALRRRTWFTRTLGRIESNDGCTLKPGTQANYLSPSHSVVGHLMGVISDGLTAKPTDDATDDDD
jgi:hypothetical protein